MRSMAVDYQSGSLPTSPRRRALAHGGRAKVAIHPLEPVEGDACARMSAQREERSLAVHPVGERERDVPVPVPALARLGRVRMLNEPDEVATVPEGAKHELALIGGIDRDQIAAHPPGDAIGRRLYRSDHPALADVERAAGTRVALQLQHPGRDDR